MKYFHSLLLLVSVVLLTLGTVRGTQPEGRLDIDGTAGGIHLAKGAVEPDGWVINAPWLKENRNQYLIGQYPSFPEWRRAGYSFTPDRDGQVSLVLRGAFDKEVQPWTLIDDIEVDGCPLENGSFESGPSGWHFDSGMVTGATIVEGGHTGAKALRVSHDGKAFRSIEVKAGKTVSITYWHRADSPISDVDSNVEHLDTVKLDPSGRWHDVSSKSGRITGMLPSGWSDDSGWAQVWASYRQDSFQGTDFLRVSIEKIVLRNGGGDRQQLCFDSLLGNPDPQKVYLLKFKARSLTGASPSFVLRMRDSPWTGYWTRQEALSSEWKTCEYKIQINVGDKVRGSMGLWITCDGEGQYDIADLSLVQLSPDEILASLQKSFNNHEPENLMRNSVFPLGLQSGWSLWRSVSDDIVNITSVQEPGNSLPCLRIEGPDARLWSAPFQSFKPDCSHLVKLTVRGQGKWSFEVKAFGKSLNEISQELDSEWREIEVAYTPSLLENMQQLFIGGSGVLEISRVVAGREAVIKTVKASERAEVSLTLPPSDASAARIQFDDEPSTINFATVSAPSAATLHTQITDLYGALTSLPPIVMKGGALERGQLDLRLEKLGSFRVEVWLEKEGVCISPVSEIVLHRLHRPRGWGRDMPDSPFGVHCQEVARNIVMAKAVGMNWVRLHDAGMDLVGWASVEPEKGKWVFRDADLARYRKGNLEIFAELGTAPLWASHYRTATNATAVNGYFKKYFQPLNNEDYATYVTTLADRYKDVIAAWDVWNEPWIKNWWAIDYDSKLGALTSEKPGADYASLMATAFDAVKAVNPKMRVAGFNTTDILQLGSNWTASVLAAGGLENCDFIDYHSYTKEPLGFPGDFISNGFKISMKPLLDKFGFLPKDVWMTEGSPAPYLIHNGLMKQTDLDGGTDDSLLIADRFCKYYTSLLSCGVKKIFIYSMHCQTGEFSSSPADWRVLTTDDGQLHPSGVGVSNFAWLIEGLPFQRLVDLGRGGYAYIFSDGKRSVAAISGRSDCEKFRLPTLPPGVEAVDLFGNTISELNYSGRMIFLNGDITSKALIDLLTHQN